MTFVTMALIVVAGILLYFLPSLVAAKRNHPSAGGIFVMNFFLGWTFIFWVFALVWACSDNSRKGMVVFVQDSDVRNMPVYPQTTLGASTHKLPATSSFSSPAQKFGLCLLAVSVILIGLALFHSSKSKDLSTTSPLPEPSSISEVKEARSVEPKELPDTARQISAPLLWRIYQENAVSADSEFKDALVEVYGEVTEISKDAFGSEIIGLRTANEFESVRAYLEKQNDNEVSALRKGDVLSVVCVGGGLIVGNPVLRKCHIHQGAVISPTHAEWDDLTPAQWKKLGFELAPREPASAVPPTAPDIEVPNPTNQ